MLYILPPYPPLAHDCTTRRALTTQHNNADLICLISYILDLLYSGSLIYSHLLHPIWQGFFVPLYSQTNCCTKSCSGIALWNCSKVIWFYAQLHPLKLLKQAKAAICAGIYLEIFVCNYMKLNNNRNQIKLFCKKLPFLLDIFFDMVSQLFHGLRPKQYGTGGDA